jgi:hypothetical protein
MKPEDPGPFKDKKIKEKLKADYGASLDEGVNDMQKALDIDKDYADAMAYMNLLIRERAFLDDDKEAYEKDVNTANDWLQKTLDTKKANAAKAAASGGGGIVEESK